jgi:hypothetical protein
MQTLPSVEPLASSEPSGLKQALRKYELLAWPVSSAWGEEVSAEVLYR